MQHTLLETQTLYGEVVALVTAHVTDACRDLLQHVGFRLQQVPVIPNPNVGHKKHFQDVYTKLHVFGLAQFDKVVYLDADMMVLRNIDHLFELPALSAAPEINPPALFNSGLLVLEPSKEVLEELMRLAPLLPSYDKTDQGFLNEMWMGSWHMLPYTYNFLKDRGALPDRFDGFVKNHLSEVYVVHMVGEKPWHCRRDHECNSQGRLSQKLWDLWNEKFKSMCSRTIRPVTCTHRSLL